MKKTYTILVCNNQTNIPDVILYNDKRDVHKWLFENGVTTLGIGYTYVYATEDGRWCMVFDRGPQEVRFSPMLPGFRAETGLSQSDNGNASDA